MHNKSVYYSRYSAANPDRYERYLAHNEQSTMHKFKVPISFIVYCCTSSFVVLCVLFLQ